MAENNIQLTLKILTLGSQGVGKTSLLQRYCHNTFNISTQSTIGIDFFQKTIEMEGKKVKLQLWDTSGQERFKGIVANYYRGSDGFLVTYSVEERQSFEQISYWIKCIQSNCDSGQVKMVLIGNKSDSNKRVVFTKEGVELAKSYKIPFFETSAHNNVNCQEAVNTLLQSTFKMVIETGKLNRQLHNQSITLNSEIRDEDLQKKKVKCC